ncbi:preprotein translocase subunit SecE [Sulfolobales archaeon HS-7]|nr:preprotein translocase subunit SecE [Sulfolobales archaeon HS-7]
MAEQGGDLKKYFSGLRDGWKRILSVSKKPDRKEFSFDLKITLLAIAVVGIIAYLIQLGLSLVFG